MEQELNPQSIIDELVKRLHAITLENVILASQVAELKRQLSERDTDNS
jgi:hypothetical protein